MKTKTCGECKYRYSYRYDEDCDGRCKLSPMARIPSNKSSCSKFEPIPPPTNGDLIRQGGNRELAEYFVYETGAMLASTLIVDKTFDTYEEAIEATEEYLNAPAESEEM